MGGVITPEIKALTRDYEAHHDPPKQAGDM